MFEKETRLETAFAVRYHEGGQDKMLLKGRRGVKVFASYNGALKALGSLGQSGEVVKVCVNVVSQAQPVPVQSKEDLVGTLSVLSKVVAEQDATFYKASIFTYQGANVIRHTPLSEKPKRQPGDTSTYLDMHLQVCITN